MQDLSNIDWSLIAPLLVIQGILVIIALIDMFRNGETKGPRWMWIPIIVLGTMIGPIVYFIFGRRQS